MNATDEGPSTAELLNATVAPHIARTLDRVIHDALTPEEIATLVEILGRIEHKARGFDEVTG